MMSFATNNVTYTVNTLDFIGTLAFLFIIFVFCWYRKVEVPQLNFDTREDIDWVAWFESMSGKNKSSSPGFVGRAIAEAKRLKEAEKEAAEAEKLQNVDPISKETSAKTTENPKGKKAKVKPVDVAADKASTKRMREVANKDKTDCETGNEKQISTRHAKKSDLRRSPIVRQKKAVTYFTNITYDKQT